MFKTEKNHQLKQYLDGQIAHFQSANSNKPTFDTIEAKLLKIERKLLGLKKQNQQKFLQSHAQQTSLIRTSASQSHQSLNGQSTPPRKEKQSQIIKFEKEVQTQAPAKKLNIISKIMSQTHFFRNSLNTTHKKTTKRAQTSSKNKQKGQILLVGNLFEREKNISNKIHKKSTKTINKSVHSDSNYQIKLLQKQIEQSWRINAQLRRKVHQLRGYQTQYCKLKQIFDQCQKLRRNRKKI